MAWLGSLTARRLLGTAGRRPLSLSSDQTACSGSCRTFMFGSRPMQMPHFGTFRSDCFQAVNADKWKLPTVAAPPRVGYSHSIVGRLIQASILAGIILRENGFRALFRRSGGQSGTTAASRGARWLQTAMRVWREGVTKPDCSHLGSLLSRPRCGYRSARRYVLA